MGGLGDELVLQPDKLLQFWVFFKPAGEPRVPDKVLRPLAGVDKVLTVVIVRVQRLGAFEKGRRVTEFLFLNTFLSIAVRFGPLFN